MFLKIWIIFIGVTFLLTNELIAQQDSIQKLNSYKYLYINNVSGSNQYKLTEITFEHLTQIGIKIVEEKDSLKSLLQTDPYGVAFCDIIYNDLASINRVNLVFFNYQSENLFTLKGESDKLLYVVVWQALQRALRNSLKALNDYKYSFDNQSYVNHHQRIDSIVQFLDEWKKTPPDLRKTLSDVEVFEIFPSFPGNTQYLNKYLYQNISIPKEVAKKFKNKKIIITFLLDKYGFVNVEKITPEELDESFKLHIKSVYEGMPRWRPGIQGAKQVNVRLTHPLTIY